MRLINVKAVLDIHEGEVDEDAEILVEQSEKTAYAILSHCWGQPQQEVLFKDMEGLARVDRAMREKIQLRSGYQKILQSCEQAHRDQLQWIWIDTCCINKESSAELSEAINSMFRWYENSDRCYAFLHDVDDTIFPTERGEERVGFRAPSKWFTRGWTLQELIAPRNVQFFNQNWTVIGDKRSLALHLERITRVPARVLKNGISSHRPSIAQIMSWAADRVTTREEDRAYSLLGLFGVYMPMLYGEGRHAFRRLQLEIIRMSNDHSIFAWDTGGRIGLSGSVLADDPSFFRNCHDVVKTEPRHPRDEFIIRLERGEEPDELVPMEGLNAFTVTNGGIQIRLSVRPYRSSPSVFRATLGCDRRGTPIGIDLASYKSIFYRYSGATGILQPIPKFQQLYLVDRNETHQFTFNLDARAVSHYGFSRCGVFPDEKASTSTQSSFTLSSSSDLVVIVYANSRVNARFAVALGCCFGQDWVHIICDEPSEQETWEDFAKKAYDQAWTAGPEYAREIAEMRIEWSCSIKHVHLPRSIWGVEVINYGGDPLMRLSDDCKVMVDVIHCTGCCYRPATWQFLYGSIRNDVDLPGLTKYTTHSANIDQHDLLVDGVPIRFLEASSSPGIELGDYGYWDFDNKCFKPEGNIFQEIKLMAPRFTVVPTDSSLLPMEHSVEGDCVGTGSNRVTSTLVRDYARQPGGGLVLQAPIALSLRNNEHLTCLIKALASRLTGKCLVTMVVQCSACYTSVNFRQPDGKIGHPIYSMSHSPDSASDPGGLLIKPRVTTPLYILSTPLLWREGGADCGTRSEFDEIRSQFYTLLGLDPSDATEVGERRETTSGPSAAIDFFRDLFGGEDLRDYIGDISFFDQLARGVDTSIANAVDAEIGADKSLTSGSPSVVHKLRGKELAATLLESMSISRGGSYDRLRWLSENKRMVQLAESISRSLGIVILEDLSVAYNTARDDFNSQGGKDNDRRLARHPQVQPIQGIYLQRPIARNTTIKSMVEDVKALQVKLNTTEDDDEQCALEEDITGRILLIGWCGIHSEIEPVLAEAMEYIMKDETVSRAVLSTRVGFLERFGRIFEEAIAEPPEQDQAHLRRIMADAKAGTSKHQLLLAELASIREVGDSYIAA